MCELLSSLLYNNRMTFHFLEIMMCLLSIKRSHICCLMSECFFVLFCFLQMETTYLHSTATGTEVIL